MRDYKRRIEESYGRSFADSHMTERYMILGEMIRDFASLRWKQTKEIIDKTKQKRVYYLSTDFLPGKLLRYNLMNLGIYELVEDGLQALGVDIEELISLESDLGLGKGNLGRISSCYLDSLTSLSLPCCGIGLRYEYGDFKQLINDGYQQEVPDQWLALGNIWEVRKPKHALDVKFWGRVEKELNAEGKTVYHHVEAEHVKAVAYDIPLMSYMTAETNTLRLWSAEASETLPADKPFHEYISEVRYICQNVYQDDNSEKGRILRLKQEYFLVSAGIRTVLKAHLRVYPDLDNLAEKAVFHLADSNVVLAVAELLRVLLDDYDYQWEKAWDIVTSCISYTTYLVAKEKSKRLRISDVKKLLPRIYLVIEEINAFWIEYLRQHFDDSGLAYQLAIIKDGEIDMDNLAVVGSFSVNGVSQLHTALLEEEVMAELYRVFPMKFNNKNSSTNHLRWLVYGNPQLKDYLKRKIGAEFILDSTKLPALMDYVDDTESQEEILEVKKERKEILADYIKNTLGFQVNTDSIFDVQANTFTIESRQILNLLYIIYLYQRMKADNKFRIYPRTFIFMGKADAGDSYGKAVIKLVHDLAQKISADEEVNDYLQLIFIPDYKNSLAEILLPATDVIEEILLVNSRVGITNNIKVMMNGGILLGTLNGTNYEIDTVLEGSNDMIFGMNSEDIRYLEEDGYDVWLEYKENQVLRTAIDSLLDGSWNENPDEYRIIFDTLMYHNDQYYVLKEFSDYCLAQQDLEIKYQNRSQWAKAMLVNIAKSGYLSSDLVIRQYAEEIWGIKKIEV